MNIQIIKQAQKIVADNSAALLTGTGVIGVVTTAVLTGRATLKAQEIIAKHERHSYDLVTHGVLEDGSNAPVEIVQEKMLVLDTVDKVKLVWPLFIPPAASAITTMSAIVFSYRISASRSAALAAAYGISEKAFTEYKEKVLEQVTPKKANDIKDAVAQQQLADNPPPASTVMMVGSGKVLCLDTFSGNYFECTVEKLRKAELEMNTDIDTRNVARLSDFYESVGLGRSDLSEEFVWDLNNHCEIDFTTQIAEDGRPCLVLAFVNAPRVMDRGSFG